MTPSLNELASNAMGNQPLVLLLALAAVAVVPFVGMMLTSFVKIAVVLSITRQAIGTQQAPPTVVITGLAAILSIYVMYPVGLQVKANMGPQAIKPDADGIYKIMDAMADPMKLFLRAQASEKNVQMFLGMGHRMGHNKSDVNPLSATDFMVLIPAFVISELTKAFQIGFIIYLPFLVVDMVVANILMALGMQMLSPSTISLPFKILLFVMVDGWHLITKGLVAGYQ